MITRCTRIETSLLQPNTSSVTGVRPNPPGCNTSTTRSRERDANAGQLLRGLHQRHPPEGSRYPAFRARRGVPITRSAGRPPVSPRCCSEAGNSREHGVRPAGARATELGDPRSGEAALLPRGATDSGWPLAATGHLVAMSGQFPVATNKCSGRVPDPRRHHADGGCRDTRRAERRPQSRVPARPVEAADPAWVVGRGGERVERVFDSVSRRGSSKR